MSIVYSTISRVSRPEPSNWNSFSFVRDKANHPDEGNACFVPFYRGKNMKKLIIILGVLGASFSAVLVRFSDAPSTVLVVYRMLWSVLLLSPMIVWKHREEFKQTKLNNILLCVVSGLFLGIHFTCYFQSLRYTSIASSVVLVDTEVFFVALGGVLFLKEKLTPENWLGIVITFAGSVIVAMGDRGGGQLLGDLIALAGAMCSAVYTLIGRRVRGNMSTTVYTWIVYFFAGLVALLTSLCGGLEVVHIGMKNVLVALGLAVMCTLLGHSIFSWGLKYEKASFISTAKLLEPIFASVLGILLFWEIPSVTSVAGGAIVICGMILCIKSSFAHETINDSKTKD